MKTLKGMLELFLGLTIISTILALVIQSFIGVVYLNFLFFDKVLKPFLSGLF